MVGERNVRGVLGRPLGYPATPTLDKMLEEKSKTQVIGEFLTWASGVGYHICVYDDGFDEFTPVPGTIEQTLAEYVGVDLAAADREREAVLAYVRGLQQEGDEG